MRHKVCNYLCGKIIRQKSVSGDAGVKQETNAGQKQNRKRDQRAKRQKTGKTGKHAKTEAETKAAGEKKKRHMPALAEQVAEDHQNRNRHPNRKAAKHRSTMQIRQRTNPQSFRLRSGSKKSEHSTHTKCAEQKKTKPRTAAITDRILGHRTGTSSFKTTYSGFSGGWTQQNESCIIVTLESLRSLL